MSEEEEVSNVRKKKNILDTNLLFSPDSNRVLGLHRPISILGLSTIHEVLKSYNLGLSAMATEALKPSIFSSVAEMSEVLKNASTLQSSIVSEALKNTTLCSSAISETLKSATSHPSMISDSFGHSISGSFAAVSEALSCSTLSSLGAPFEALKDYSILGSFARVSEALESSGFSSYAAISEVLKNVNSSLSFSKMLVFDNWTKTNTQIFDLINKRILFTQKLNTKILPILYRFNWFISVSLDDKFIKELSQVIEGGSNKLANDLRSAFIDYFSKNNYKNLEKMVTGWADNPLFKPRMKILKDSVNLLKYSHNSYNPANLLIPTLISQIDGFLTDYLIENQFKVIKVNKQWIWQDKNMKNNYSREQVYKKIFDPTVQDYSLTNGGSTTSLEIGSDFILNTLFQTAYTRQDLKKPFGLSRHKIMHGENTTYGRKDHLFRTFLVLDFLYGLENVDCK